MLLERGARRKAQGARRKEDKGDPINSQEHLNPAARRETSKNP
jgi:hypothetical protein